MENQQPSSSSRKEIEQELIKGRDAANQLLEVFIHKSYSHHGDIGDGEGLILPYVEDLARNILRSFTNTLILLNNKSDVSHDQKNLAKLEDTDETCKGTFINAKNRRGCYKRKSNALTWEEDSSILIEDGYAWRKYGQKEIIKKKYLRSYYRCSYKYDEKCPATKQVQKIQEEPPLYRTTYHGSHNCKSSLINPKMIFEPDNSSSSSKFLCFNNVLPSKEEFPSLFASMKKENIEVIPDEYYIPDYNQLTSSDYLMFWDYEVDSTI